MDEITPQMSIDAELLTRPKALNDPSMVYRRCPDCKHMCVEAYGQPVGVLGKDPETGKLRGQITIDLATTPLTSDSPLIIEYEGQSQTKEITYGELMALVAIAEFDVIGTAGIGNA